jgi:hypothetical protein
MPFDRLAKVSVGPVWFSDGIPVRRHPDLS